LPELWTANSNKAVPSVHLPYSTPNGVASRDASEEENATIQMMADLHTVFASYAIAGSRTEGLLVTGKSAIHKVKICICAD
jgi:hypothetical protein